MKSVNFSKLFAVSLVLAVVAVGCKKSPKSVTPIPSVSRTVPNVGPTPPIGGSTMPDDGNVNRSQQNESGLSQGDAPREEDGNYFLDRDTFREQTIYFDLDSSSVRPGERFKVEAVATYLKNNPTFHVKVEGHCDERGTAEYNRALGERRALSAREVIAGLGIAGDRIATLSFGEDQPAVTGQDEAAWSRNRRAEIVLMKPKQ